MKPKDKRKERKIKAWAILMSRNKIASIEFSKSKPKRYAIGTWLFFVTPEDKVVPCTITYTP